MTLNLSVLRTFVCILAIVLCAGCSSYKYFLPKGPDLTEIQSIQDGSSYFVMNAYKHSGRKTIRVWSYKPERWASGDKVLVVMHGMSRNAKEYLDEWKEIAQQKNILVIAPEFHSKFYRITTNDYQDGNIYNFFGEKNPKEEWAFQVIENIIDHINEQNAFEINRFDIFGHSAGSQFVHRMILLFPNSRINKAIAANAGVYTFPDAFGDYPYTLPTEYPSLSNAFKSELVILLGENDTSSTSGFLDESDLAMRQGQHRLERGKQFFRISEKLAIESGYLFNWDLKIVPDAGHNKRQMIKAAGELL